MIHFHILLIFRDVQTAEAALARHNEIGDEIRTRQDEFGQLASLGETMYARAPSQDIQVHIKYPFIFLNFYIIKTTTFSIFISISFYVGIHNYIFTVILIITILNITMILPMFIVLKEQPYQLMLS